ncbi:MAG: YvcK family protein [Armatimonadota bacterium]|nr:YvcK family protein [Armatimonadota bacterium]
MNGALRRALGWLHPGLKVKRWLALLTLGLAALSFGTLLIANLTVFDLMGSLGGPQRATAVGIAAVILGLAAVAVALRQLVRSVASALHPEAGSRLVDLMLNQRRLQVGPRVVTIGGGTGLSTILRGLKQFTTNITAIATVADDGGSSGRLREDMGVPAPGDIRNCLVALADSEPLMTELFQYRFNGQARGLNGHSFGNLLIAALTEITGDFEQAIRETSRVLAIRGRVLPPTADPVTLCAKMRDDSVVRGESSITAAGKEIDYVYLDPPDPGAPEEVTRAISRADLIVIGPGSTFTSVIPNFLVSGVCEAVMHSGATKVFICNIMTQPGETTGFTAADHVRAIQRHTGELPFDYVLMNSAPVEESVLEKYRATGADIVEPDYTAVARMGLIPVRAELVSLTADGWVRHDPREVAGKLVELLQERAPALV